MSTGATPTPGRAFERFAALARPADPAGARPAGDGRLPGLDAAWRTRPRRPHHPPEHLARPVIGYSSRVPDASALEQKFQGMDLTEAPHGGASASPACQISALLDLAARTYG
jgi:hypothetical protein